MSSALLMMLKYRRFCSSSMQWNVDDGCWKDEFSVVRVGQDVRLMGSDCIRKECRRTICSRWWMMILEVMNKEKMVCECVWIRMKVVEKVVLDERKQSLSLDGKLCRKRRGAIRKVAPSFSEGRRRIKVGNVVVRRWWWGNDADEKVREKNAKTRKVEVESVLIVKHWNGPQE